MSREFLESYEEDGMTIDVYMENGEIMMDVNESDNDYDDIYGPTDVSGDFGGEG